MKNVAITGNTYPVKDQLRRLGARWNADGKAWMIREDLADQARAIVAGNLNVQSVPKNVVILEHDDNIDNPVRTVSVNWSAEQLAIFDWFHTGQGNMVVQARAGTGKTTTIVEAISRATDFGKYLYAVFNKKNQKEAEAKIKDKRVEVRTLHSLGLYFIKLFWQDAKPDDNVEWDRIKRVAPNAPEEVHGQIMRLVGFCKNLFITIPEINEVIDVADARGIVVEDELVAQYPTVKLAQIAIDVLKESLNKDFASRISFNDMVWLPVAQGWVKPMFALVVVDEAQDMNMPQLIMAIRACLEDGRICIVGDNRQAIYAFRGAAQDGMHMMKERLNAAQLGLNTTYRCPKSVVALAQEIVPDYTAAPTAPEGEILDLNMDAAVSSLVPGDAVISRLNAPIMGVALALLRRGTPARIEGKDIGKQLVDMVKKLRAKSVPDFIGKLNTWGEKMIRRIQAAGGRHAASKVELVNDQVATLSAVAEGAASVSDIEQKLVSLFEDSASARRPAVVCSTVHKAKGLEWGKVCLIMDSFKNRHASEEEANIYYVAVTRAKRTLVRMT